MGLLVKLVVGIRNKELSKFVYGWQVWQVWCYCGLPDSLYTEHEAGGGGAGEGGEEGQQLALGDAGAEGEVSQPGAAARHLPRHRLSHCCHA